MNHDLYEQIINMYDDRVGVLIGKSGKVKKQLSESTNTEVIIDSDMCQVKVRGENLEDVMTAVNII